MQRGTRVAIWYGLAMLAVFMAGVGLAQQPPASDPNKEQFVPILIYRTGPYAAGGSGIMGGFMDYMADPPKVVEKALSLTRSKVFFSFPLDGGVFAWNRRRLYRKRCDLYLYTREQLERLFAGFPEADVSIERIARDFFVTATVWSGRS